VGDIDGKYLDFGYVIFTFEKVMFDGEFSDKIPLVEGEFN